MKHDYDIKLDCEQALIYNLINYVQNEDHIEMERARARDGARDGARDK